MVGGRLGLVALFAAAALSCGGATGTSSDDGSQSGTPAGGATEPEGLCGVSTVVTGQKIWGLQLAVSDGQVLYTTYGEGTDLHHHALWTVPVDGGEPSLLWRGPSGILGSGLLPLDGAVYLSTQLAWGAGEEGVLAIPAAGGDARTVARFPSACAAYGGTAYDDANVYAAASGCPAGTGSILALPRSGGAPTTLWSGDHVGDGAASIARRGTDLFFLRDDDDDGDGAVVRLSTSGGAATEIGAVDEARGLAVDDAGVYVAVHDSVLLLPADGSAPVTLASRLNHPVAIAVDATGVYVATGEVEDGATGRVLRIPRGGGAPVVMARDQPAIFALALDDTAVYWASETGGLVARAGKCP